jgi:glutathione peroxidase
MLKILFIALSLLAVPSTSIYDFKVKSIDGGEIDFSEFKGKKILIANISTQSSLASQIATLETIQQRYKSKLVIVAVPSNSFGKEPLGNEAIRKKLRQDYKASFYVSEPMSVWGPNISPLYKWLTLENNQLRKQVGGDYHKYLINSNGEVMGYFIGAVMPTDSILLKAFQLN